MKQAIKKYKEGEMALEEAIKELIAEHQTYKRANRPNFYDAVGLGIEALKRVKDLRRNEPPFKTAEELLPSETRE